MANSHFNLKLLTLKSFIIYVIACVFSYSMRRGIVDNRNWVISKYCTSDYAINVRSLTSFCLWKLPQNISNTNARISVRTRDWISPKIASSVLLFSFTNHVYKTSCWLRIYIYIYVIKSPVDIHISVYVALHYWAIIVVCIEALERPVTFGRVGKPLRSSG